MTSHENKYHVKLGDVVQTVFIILKLCRLIDWSWWAVLTPFWVSIGFTAVQVIILGIVHMVKRSEQQDGKQE